MGMDQTAYRYHANSLRADLTRIEHRLRDVVTNVNAFGWLDLTLGHACKDAGAFQFAMEQLAMVQQDCRLMDAEITRMIQTAEQP
jgi:hypothetical protein